MDYNHYRAGEGQSFLEMRQKQFTRDTFFNVKNGPYMDRPTSVATEIVDTDWDEQDTLSEAGEDSPRLSLHSSGGQRSITTISSYDEAPTPRSAARGFADPYSKQVEGPRGPHLFRSSTAPSMQAQSLNSSYQSLHDDEHILTLSPITPKVARGLAPSQIPRSYSVFQYTNEALDRPSLAAWTPEMVAQSMLNAGIEPTIADRFVENDINGAILITLKFEDLRELDIPSFGVRTRVWHQIQSLRDSRPTSPRPSTPIEDVPSREARKESRDESRNQDEPNVQRATSRRRRRRPSNSPVVAPGDSVSIIGIEQVIPKLHQCSKGENCSKWRKQQRVLEEFRRVNPNVEIKAGGTVVIVGDAGNPETAKAMDPNDMLRPFSEAVHSDAVPSMVASSDVFGLGGLPPLQYLQEAALRNLRLRDPQDNVRQFLDFQHQQPKCSANEVPPTPPFEVNPLSPRRELRRLPRLSIPERPAPPRQPPPRAATVPPPETQEPPMLQRLRQEPETFPQPMDKADPMSPDLETPRNPYRFGTPFSEMDVPVTAVPIGPVARDISQSVPPDMNYRTNSHAPMPRSRRPSFPVLPALDEDKPVRLATKSPSPSKAKAVARTQQQLQAPPRPAYPWTAADRRPGLEQAVPPSNSEKISDTLGLATSNPDGVTHQGPMKKRKTRMLRHEWQDGYFTLKGTRLNMHKHAGEVNRTLEYIDVDDYAIACSSVASQSKLSAAFKAVSLHNREKSDPVGAFAFQLIPQDKDKVNARLRKRDSTMASQGGVGPDGVNGTGKTHHFAVTGRDDRIDWMRELMLAKAMKQKGEGFEISVNGNMI